MTVKEHLTYNCSTRMGVHIPAKHVFFEYDQGEKGGNTEVNLHPYATHIVDIRQVSHAVCENILL